MFLFKIKSGLILILMSAVLTLSWSIGRSEVSDSTEYSIAVFVPGMLEGSPTYEQMDRGVRKAADMREANVTTIEGGFNQGEWQNQITALAAEGNYNLIVTSNPALNEICLNAKAMFPGQTFLVMDGADQESEELIIFSYNHGEQAFMAGVLAAEISMEKDSENKIIGLIAGQSFPDMEQSIVPGFEMGIKSVDPDFSLDFRIIGNWYDASKASDLAESMFSLGVNVILPIAGGANQGVISAAKKKDKSLIWFDSPGTKLSEGTIKGSGIVKQETAAKEMVLAIIDGKMEDGDLKTGDGENGYVLIDESEELYIKYVSTDIREKISYMMEQFKSGRFKLEF